MGGIEACKAFLLLEPSIERQLILAIDLNLAKTGELRVETQGAELLNFLVGARSLCAELVAGEVENFKPLVLITRVRDKSAI